MAKKYFWLKLMNDFFQQPKMKKLRRIAGGDTYTIIYLKMQLLSLKTDGKLYFDGVEDNFAAELALTIDEEEENVLFTLLYLQKQGLIEQVTEREYALPETMKRIGSESESAQRMRRLRENQKEAKNLAAQELPALPEGPKASQCDGDVRTSDTEIEIEKEIELDSEIEIEGEKNGSGGKPPETQHARKKSSRFVPPSLEEVKAYCAERGNLVDAERFFNYYEAANWYRGNTKIKDWRACVRTWEQKEQKAPRYSPRAQDDRNRVKTEAEHAQGGHASGFGW